MARYEYDDEARDTPVEEPLDRFMHEMHALSKEAAMRIEHLEMQLARWRALQAGTAAAVGAAEERMKASASTKVAGYER